ncbi:hypothetical protein [Sphingobacterium hungaricum]|nr:hypothetical protein [Sphingobacterium hungaricum]
MHRKTHSKNTEHPSKDAAFLERIVQFRTMCHSLMERYPFHFFVSMLICILISAVLAFTVMRVEKSTELPTFPGLATGGVTKNTTDIIGLYGAIIELEELQHSIAAIIQKDSLSDRDSIRLSDALKRYEQIQRSLIHTGDTSTAP